MPILRPIVPEKRQVLGEKIALAAWDHPGSEPPILFCHCTGICARVWDPVIARLSIPNRIIAPDARGHGDSDKPRVPAEYTWRGFAEDVLAAADAMNLPEGAWAVGHSGGASAIVCAELMQPGRFSKIILIDAIIAPPEFFPAALLLAEKSRKRRHTFDSRLAARQRLGNKPPMENWHPEVLDAYIEHGFSDADDGSVTLKCPGKIEAWIYEYGGVISLYDRLGEIHAETLVVTGENSYMVEHTHHQHSHFPHGELITLPNTGHFIPQEKPEETAAIISDWFRGE